MIQTAKAKFRDFLKCHKITDDFKQRVSDAGLSFDDYLEETPAIYAIRRVVDLYDGSKYAVMACSWECRVILDRLDPSMSSEIVEHGAETVIKMVRFMQKKGTWDVPNKLSAPIKYLPPVDDKPLPPVKEIKIVESDSTDDFEFIDISHSNSTRSILDEYHIRVHVGNKGNYVVLNKYLCEQIQECNCLYARLRRDTLTRDIHLVFSNVHQNGSVTVSKKKGSVSMQITSKALCEFIKDWAKNDATVFNLRTSKNLSHSSNTITIKLIKE